MKWTATTPASRPLDWGSLQRHLKAPIEDMDYVLELLDEATSYAENKLEMSLMVRTITATYWHQDVNDYAAAVYPLVQTGAYAVYPVHHRHALNLPRGPVASITSVLDANSVAQPYTQEKVGNSDRLRLTPTATIVYPVTVTYTAGYAASTDVPADIRGAIRVHVATKYAIRESVMPGTTTTVTNLDDFYRYRGRGCPVM